MRALRRLARPHRTGALLGAVSAGLLLLAPVARGGVEVQRNYPRQGEPVEVTVTTESGLPAGGDTLRAVYRPSSEVSREETVGIVGSDGRIRWTPLEAGVVTLSAIPPAHATERSVQSVNLSVPFASTPVAGVVVLLVAGVILYGGVIRGFRHLNTPPPPLPPDT